jgi:hypothetical protein
VLVIEELEEAKTNLHTLTQEFAGSEQWPQNNMDLGPDISILLLIV